VDELLKREGRVEKRLELRTRWGECEESDAEIGMDGADADFTTMFNSPPAADEKAAKGQVL
tara:strand:+ start:688 stop:870 length:183 start_codon:yes stop_codon:yes gene_type:complete